MMPNCNTITFAAVRNIPVHVDTTDRIMLSDPDSMNIADEFYFVLLVHVWD